MNESKFPYKTSLVTTARRLRTLRRNPQYSDPDIHNWGDEYFAGKAAAYEDALRIILDEFNVSKDDWWDMMYGLPGESPDPSTNN